MEFYINGNKTDVTLENEKTVGDVLTSFAQTCEDNKAAVIGIVVDGETITADTFDKASEKPLSASTKFEFNVVTEGAISESFIQLSMLFEELAIEMENIPVNFQSGKAQVANMSIKKLADNIENFCHIATLAHLFPETFKEFRIRDMEFTEFFNEFSPVLSDFEGALQNDDTVLIGDLAEYEICPRLRDIAQSLKNI
ncbi:MAG: hypothetical protein MJ176_06540 [Treponema sp.]|nr:hypothetical protein [Treponema sp.]